MPVNGAKESFSATGIGLRNRFLKIVDAKSKQLLRLSPDPRAEFDSQQALFDLLRGSNRRTSSEQRHSKSI